MIRPLAAFLHVLDAARTAGTLARTVRVLARQLDNAHLLAASEGARADRAELRVAELENEIRDWREASGELAREQPAADPLPDLTDAGEAPTAVVDHAREAAYQCDRANALAATLHATEAVVLDLRAACARTERELREARAQQAQTEAAAGAHIATIERLQEQIAAAHRAAHAPARSLESRAEIAWRAWDEAPDSAPGGAPPPDATGWDSVYPGAKAAWCAVVRACDTSAAPAEQIPGVAAVGFEVCDACGGLTSDGQRTGEAEAVLLCRPCRAKAEAEEAKRADARRYDMEYDSARNVLPPRDAADDPPATKPSERPASPKESSR